MRNWKWMGLLGAAVLTPLQAEQVDQRHGAVVAGHAAVEGGITATYQWADDSAVDDEAFASLDLVATLAAGPGEWVLYVEGNTTPSSDGVANLLGEANYDSGSALDRDGKGRLQVSELHYNVPWAGASWSFGLMDLTGFLDASDVANDETSQFLGSSFGNNPSIAFPDYTLGGAYHREANAGLPEITFVLAGSHGLADNDDVSYSELFKLGESEKGIFAALETGFEGASWYARVGVWGSSAEHETLDGTDTDASNYGVYLSLDGSLAAANWNLRLGLANDEVSEAAQFVGLAVEYPLQSVHVGAAIAHIGLADDAEAPGRDDTHHAELYGRVALWEGLEITPSVQWIENSGFDSSDASIDDSQLVLSVRGNYTF